MEPVDLLDKTEVWVEDVTLSNTNLDHLAEAAAAALGLPARSIFVTDVRDQRVVFDVLQPFVELTEIVGRERALLNGLRAVDGVAIGPDGAVHSRGVLGAIGLPEGDRDRILEDLRRLDEGVRAWVQTRVAVIATGGEVEAGEVVDTNSRTIAERLGAEGFDVTSAGTVPDDDRAIAGRILRLVQNGFGVVITTGGVGAEDKDRTIETLEMIDPELGTAVLATYEPGHGRHVKPHVRVAVASLGDTRIVALPGPNREVAAVVGIVAEGLRGGWGKERFAEEIATVIRALTATTH